MDRMSMVCFKRIALLPMSTVGVCLLSQSALVALPNQERVIQASYKSTNAFSSPPSEARNAPPDTPSPLPPLLVSSSGRVSDSLSSDLPDSGTRSPLAVDVATPLTNISMPEFSGMKLAQQTTPNEERLPLPDPLPPDDETIEPATPDSEPAPVDSSNASNVEFEVRSIEVVGSSIFEDEDFAPITSPVEGTRVTLDDLQHVADAITQHYLDQGYLTSRAILVDQVITDGDVRIQVVEGRIGEIQIQNEGRLRDEYIRDRVALGTHVPLRTDRLENQLRLLRSDPLIENVEASLRAGDELGESVLIVRVTETDPFIGEIRSDNYSPPSVGSERVGVTFGYGNLTGRGDSFIVNYDRTAQGGSQVADFNYRIPVNPMSGSVQLRAVIDRNEVVQEPFDALDIEGESERYEITYRQPFVRSPREEFALSFGFSYRDGQALAFDRIPLSIGSNDQGVTRTSVLRFGQDYVKRDFHGAWALRSQFSIGVDIFNATANDGMPDSRFLSWLGQAQRVQQLGNDHLLIAQLDMQFTPDALLSSEQFVIGGGQSLRGFRQNARAGDNGVRFSLEDRITLVRNEAGAATFQLAPFVDLGVVWNDADNVDLPDQTFLAGIGAGLLWEMFPNFNVRLDFALPLIDLDDRGNNVQDDGIYFSVNYEL